MLFSAKLALFATLAANSYYHTQCDFPFFHQEQKHYDIDKRQNNVYKRTTSSLPYFFPMITHIIEENTYSTPQKKIKFNSKNIAVWAIIGIGIGGTGYCTWKSRTLVSSLLSLNNDE